MELQTNSAISPIQREQRCFLHPHLHPGGGRKWSDSIFVSLSFARQAVNALYNLSPVENQLLIIHKLKPASHTQSQRNAFQHHIIADFSIAISKAFAVGVDSCFAWRLFYIQSQSLSNDLLIFLMSKSEIRNDVCFSHPLAGISQQQAEWVCYINGCFLTMPSLVRLCQLWLFGRGLERRENEKVKRLVVIDCFSTVMYATYFQFHDDDCM